ncbi:MAG: hypothetical protein K9I71_03580 [Ignavibacteriales bacterium]|nr:hypothetical protein [Ignavibacteriales bacterium]MCF8435829.1 hypothetical protein [Ignavibacteriales bacterium]
MRIKIILLALILTSTSLAQSGIWLLPGMYYTSGSYSNQWESTTYSAFLPVYLPGGDYLIIGYDNHRIDSTDWTYKQSAYTAAYNYNSFPIFLKFAYSHIGGKFNYKYSNDYDYSDTYDFAAVNAKYYIAPLYLGLGYSFGSMAGFQDLKSHQLNANLVFVFSNYFLAELQPVYSSVSDNRKLFSAALNLSFYSDYGLTVYAGGFLGKRAFYYNIDLLTVFNQFITQKSGYSLKAEYSVNQYLKIQGSYLHTAFELYDIDYITAGLKFNFGI